MPNHMRWKSVSDITALGSIAVCCTKMLGKQKVSTRTGGQSERGHGEQHEQHLGDPNTGADDWLGVW